LDHIFKWDPKEDIQSQITQAGMTGNRFKASLAETSFVGPPQPRQKNGSANSQEPALPVAENGYTQFLTCAASAF
jgi:hypothetical protein